MKDIKVFNRWSIEGITVQDPGLVNYINLEPTIVPKTGGKNVGIRFHKSKTFIVERFMNKLMVPGHKSKKHFRTTSKGCRFVWNIITIPIRQPLFLAGNNLCPRSAGKQRESGYGADSPCSDDSSRSYGNK